MVDERLSLKQALATWEADLPADRLFMAEYIAALKARFGTRSPLLESFGINPARPKPPRTSAEKTVSAALGVRTRRVRGTKGAKQKAAITADGKPGLILVSPTGVPIEGAVPGPTPPAADPADTTAAPATGNSGTGTK